MFLDTQKLMLSKVGKITLFTLLLINIILLDWKIFTETNTNKASTGKEIVIPALPPSIPVNEIKEDQDSCPAVCLKTIREATAETKQSVNNNQTPNTQTSSSKEVFIPLGTGSTKSTSWLDLPGVEVYIDTSKYKNIKEANFEVTLRIPTANGKAFARLYNVTDSHPVWFSEISAEGQSGILVKSSNISFDSGNKLYRIQLYSTMGFEVFLDNARIKIIYE